MPTKREMKAVGALLRDLRSPTICDIGSHTGEEESWLRMACRERVHYVMVEPDPRNCQAILDRGPVGTEANRRLFIGAIADSAGMREFHMSWNPRERSHGSGSLLKPEAHLTAIPACEFPCKTMVNCITLDQLFVKEWLSKIDLLWVDIQGSEAGMIRGGQMALSKTRYLFMEAEIEPLYAGQSTRAELLAMLPGWKLLGEYDCNVLMANERFEG